jgi:hypothetical protein
MDDVARVEGAGTAQPADDQPIDVFISYSSKDVAKATLLETLLTKRGLKVWRDKTRLDQEATGTPYTPAIRKAVDAARKVVVLWSPDAVASTWVGQEASAALEARKLVPLLIAKCELVFPHSLNHTINADDIAGRIDVIARAIGAEIPGGTLTTPPERIRYRLPTSAKTDELIGRDTELSALFTA